VKVFVVALQQNGVSVRKAYAVFVARAWVELGQRAVAVVLGYPEINERVIC